jgi:conjugal transfer ATP-binding protein TraC
MMLSSFQNIGKKIAHLFGDVDLGHASNSFSQQDHKAFSGQSFADYLPYVSYDEENGLFVGDNTIGFSIEAVPLVGGDSAAQKVLSSLFTELLEEDGSIQCLLFADNRIDPFLNAWESARSNSKEIRKELSKKRTKYFKSSNLCPRVFRFVISYSVRVNGRDMTVELANLKSKKEKFLETLKSLTHARCWNAQDLIEFVGGMTNFSLSPHIKASKWNKYQDLRSQMGTGGKISVEEDRLEWITDTETIFKSYRTLDFPQFWSMQQMQALIGDMLRDGFRVQSPFYLHFGVHFPKQSKEENKFNRNAFLIENQGRSSMLRRWIPELDKELKENDYIRKTLNEGAGFVWTQLSAGIWAKKDKINQAEQALKGLFRINHFLLSDNRCIHLPQFISALPMTWATYSQDLKNLNLLRTTITPECVNFVPIQGEWMGTQTPGMLLMGRRGQLLNWNPFDNKVGNYNTIVVGRSGSGKSVFMQDLLMSGLSTGAKVFILEVGRSFEKMSDLLEGQQIEFSKESAICLNPFTHISLVDEDERNTSLSYLKAVIGCMAAPTDGTSDYENSLIEEAVRAAWNKNKTDATISDVADCLSSHLDPRAHTLATMLMPYTKHGIYAKHFEGKNNVNFNNEMVLIELEELKEKKDLQAVVLQLFIMEITNQAFLSDRKTPFYICIDEAWDLLRGKQSGPFIETLARRLRKYNGSLVIGTQSIEDFFSSPGAKAAFENSDWMCLLSQRQSSIAALVESKRLNFDDAKKHALENVTTRRGEFSEVMILDAEGNYSIARLIIDPFSQLLYTTRAEEYAKIKEFKKQGLSIVEAIEKYLSIKDAHG